MAGGGGGGGGDKFSHLFLLFWGFSCIVTDTHFMFVFISAQSAGRHDATL